jgi:type III pantothenate kinase
MSERLLIDAGNTRLKWRLERGVEVVDRGALDYADRDSWRKNWMVGGQPASIWVGSVAGEAIDRDIAAWAASNGFGAPTFVAVAREQLGLRVAYRDTARLGVDRYLAMLGARTRFTDALCVCDVGTALTLDAVDARGMHKGGLIAPGPVTMVNSILSGTAGINDASKETPASPFARDTADAVTGGARFACAALVDRFVAEAATLFGADVTLVLAGGDRERVAPHLRTLYEDAPDVVFDGLRALADAALRVRGRPVA